MNLSKKKLLVGVALLAAVGGGCQDFLVAPPQGTLDELTLANAAGVEATLIGAYRPLGAVTNEGGAPSNWLYGNVASDDSYKGTEPADLANANDLELYNWANAGAHAILNNKWVNVYEGISRANATLRLLARVQTEQPGALSETQISGIRGEAIFLRAHYHFEAWRMWGRVPHYTEADNDFRKPNDLTPQQVIERVLADLDAAIAALPVTSRNNQRGRVHQWTARAYRARVLAHNGNWQAALPALREVEQSGRYNLEPSMDFVWTGFVNRANGPETILAYQASSNDGETGGGNANTGERLRFPHSGSPFTCCGFDQPTQNLVNYFRVDASGLPLWSASAADAFDASASWNASNAVLNAAASSQASVFVDPRLDWTVGRDGVPYKDWESLGGGRGIHSPNWIREPGFGGPYSPKKHVHERASGAQSNVGWNSQHLNSVNIHIFRYADLLLLLAEAEVEAGGAGGLEAARTLVNRIRTRAGARAQGPGTDAASMAVPINDPRITWANYRVGLYPAGSFASQAAARNLVRAERRLELATEGPRLFDLQRWGIHQDVLNRYIQVERGRRAHLGAAATVAARHRWWPIPNRQLELSQVEGENRLTQNEGW
jgi:starch-binding outer membrane protein, SusD/RagB family